MSDVESHYIILVCDKSKSRGFKSNNSNNNKNEFMYFQLTWSWHKWYRDASEQLLMSTEDAETLGEHVRDAARCVCVCARVCTHALVLGKPMDSNTSRVDPCLTVLGRVWRCLRGVTLAYRSSLAAITHSSIGMPAPVLLSSIYTQRLISYIYL